MCKCARQYTTTAPIPIIDNWRCGAPPWNSGSGVTPLWSTDSYNGLTMFCWTCVNPYNTAIIGQWPATIYCHSVAFRTVHIVHNVVYYAYSRLPYVYVLCTCLVATAERHSFCVCHTQRAQRTKARGPKDIQLEVGARRPPRLLVFK